MNNTQELRLFSIKMLQHYQIPFIVFKTHTTYCSYSLHSEYSMQRHQKPNETHQKPNGITRKITSGCVSFFLSFFSAIHKCNIHNFCMNISLSSYFLKRYFFAISSLHKKKTSMQKK